MRKHSHRRRVRRNPAALLLPLLIVALSTITTRALLGAGTDLPALPAAMAEEVAR